MLNLSAISQIGSKALVITSDSTRLDSVVYCLTMQEIDSLNAFYVDAKFQAKKLTECNLVLQQTRELCDSALALNDSSSLRLAKQVAECEVENDSKKAELIEANSKILRQKTTIRNLLYAIPIALITGYLFSFI